MSALIDKLKEDREEVAECCVVHFEKINSKLDKIIRMLEIERTRIYAPTSMT